MATVFISYRRNPSSALANTVMLELEKRGISAFLDTNHKEGGDFETRLLQEIESSLVFVCLLSKDTLDSEWVKKEIRHAYTHNRLMIPIFHEGYIPPEAQEEPIDRLFKSQAVEIFDKKGIYFKAAFDELADMIKKVTKESNILQDAPVPSSVNPTRGKLLDKVEDVWIKNFLNKTLDSTINLVIEKHPNMPKGKYIFPKQLILEQHGGHPLSSMSEIVDVFNASNESLLILGKPGVGKTTAVLELARGLVEAAKRDAQQEIPLVFLLSEWDKPQSLADWLVAELFKRYDLPSTLAEGFIKQQKFILLLDGLDEIKSDKQTDFLKAFDDFRQAFPSLGVAISCREAEYQQFTERPKLNWTVKIQPLSTQQIDEYLRQMNPELVKIVRSAPNLLELVDTPLMLKLISQTADTISFDDLDKFPSKERTKYILRLYVQKMLELAHNDDAFDRYPEERFLHWLSWLANQMKMRSQTVFAIEQLNPDWLRSRADKAIFFLTVGLVFTLLIAVPAGLSLKYIFGWENEIMVFSTAFAIGLGALAANEITLRPIVRSALIAFLLGLMTAVHFAPRSEVRNGLVLTLTVGIISWFVVWMIILVNFGSSKRLKKSINPVEELQFNRWKGIAGLIVGLMLCIGMTYLASPLYKTISVIAFVLPMALSLGSTGGLEAREVEPVERKRPNQGMFYSAKNAALIAIFVTLFSGVVGGSLATLSLPLASSILYGCLIGITVGAMAGLNWGGYDFLKHIVLRVYLSYIRHDLPKLHQSNYAQFLEHAVKLQLMHRLGGGGYLFIHRMLGDEYFVDGIS